jgi:hypothetical protein
MVRLWHRVRDIELQIGGCIHDASIARGADGGSNVDYL